MSFKIKVSDLSPSLIQACRTISSSKLSFSNAWHMKTLGSKIDKALTFLEEKNAKIIENYREGMKAHVELDEKGNFVLDTFKEDHKGPDGEVMFKAGDKKPNSYVEKSEEDKKAIEELAKKTKKEMEELQASEVDIDYSKLPLSALEDIQLSADDLDSLEPILDIPEEVANNVIPMKK